MAKCSWCDQEMMDGGSCKDNKEVKYPDGTTLPSIPYEPDGGPEGRKCHDCGTPVGGKHHPGCDMERCPRCHGQLISCGCLNDPDEGEEVEKPHKSTCYLIGYVDRKTLKVVRAQFASENARSITVEGSVFPFDIIEVDAQGCYGDAHEEMLRFLKIRPWFKFYGWVFPLLREAGEDI